MEQFKELWDKLGEALLVKFQEQQEDIEILRSQISYLECEQNKLKGKNKKLSSLLRDAASYLDDNNSW